MVLATLAAAVALSTAPGAALAAQGTGDLYLQEASGGTLVNSKLVLRGVARRVSAFTDRPERLAGSIPTGEFVARWSRSFGDDPPNAALQIDEERAGRDVALLELRRPRYDRRKRTLTYTVRRLKRASGGLRPFGRRADRDVAGRFGDATLFIDSGSFGNDFFIELTAPPGQATTSLTLANGIFDLEAQGAVVPLSTVTAPLSVDSARLSLQGRSTGSPVVLVKTWIDVDAATLTGTASVPEGGKITVTVGGKLSVLSDGPFSLPMNP
jgi:hypothetical protein